MQGIVYTCSFLFSGSLHHSQESLINWLLHVKVFDKSKTLLTTTCFPSGTDGWPFAKPRNHKAEKEMLTQRQLNSQIYVPENNW